jgi:hypothetical protein
MFIACNNIYIALGCIDIIWNGNSVFREWTVKMLRSFFGFQSYTMQLLIFNNILAFLPKIMYNYN